MRTEKWFREAIIYGIDISKFKDSNGDGIGDFGGLTAKLDYFKWLGVNTLWLLPFFPSPFRDNGYDVKDYYTINPDYGSLEDFLEFMKEAKKRDLKIIMDLVLHHTSDEHPWFMASAYGEGSKYDDYYVWSKKKPDESSAEPIFPGAEASTWTYHPVAKSHYFHRFYHFQPDLKIKNPEVQKEIFSIMDFWLSFGVDGFRLDALSHMIQEKGKAGTQVDKPEKFITKIKDFIQSNGKHAALLAEADVTPDELDTFIGSEEKMDMLFNFIFNNYLFLALASHTSAPFQVSFDKTTIPLDKCQWVNFIRNLDELDLERLTEEERELVMKEFGPEKNMRVYNRGIRRRFAPMVKGERARMELAFSILFSIPGNPAFVYGDEIGMGDDLSLEERNSVRTPMQWTSGTNAGFSENKDTITPVISKGPFSHKYVNVGDQQKDKGSFLNWVKELIQMRKKHADALESKVEIVKTPYKEVLLIRFSNNEEMVTLHNLSPDKKVLSLPEEYRGKKMKVIFSPGESNHDGLSAENLVLEGYAYLWLTIS